VTELLLLSDCLGRRVRDDAGATLGRIADVEVEGSERFPRVLGLVVATRGGEAVVPWRVLHGDRVARDARRAPLPSRHGRVLRLARDALDAQVVDLGGLRVARVGDVELAERDGELRAVAVEVGLASVLRRLGLRRLARRVREEWIGWDAVYLASGRGHRLQLEHRAADVQRLDHEALTALVAHLPPARGAEVLVAAQPGRHADPVAAARRTRRRGRRFPMMRARKRAPS
jgi:sporulation protein YlmC with PRC-barrel domain